MIPDKISFPTNFAWSSSNSHMFKPRALEGISRNMIVETFLRTDKDFKHLLRQCPNFWLVAITIGQDTVHLNIYDPDEVDNPRTRRISTNLNRDHAVIVHVDRKGDIYRVAEARQDLVATTSAQLYSVRSLRKAEIDMFDSMERTFDGRTLITATDAMLQNYALRKLDIEVPTIETQ